MAKHYQSKPGPKPSGDVDVIKGMAAIGCTYQEISDVTGLSVSNLQKTYGEEYREAQGSLKSSLRRQLLKLALEDPIDEKVLLRVADRYLGPITSKVEQTVSGPDNGPLQVAYVPRLIDPRTKQSEE